MSSTNHLGPMRIWVPSSFSCLSCKRTKRHFFWIAHFAIIHMKTSGSFYSVSHSTHDLHLTMLRPFEVLVLWSSLLECWFYVMFDSTSWWWIQALLFLIYTSYDHCCDRLRVSDQASLIFIAIGFYLATLTCFWLTLKMSTNIPMSTLKEMLDLR